MSPPDPSTTVSLLACSADLSEFKRAVLSIKLLGAEELEQFEPEALGGAVGLAKALIRGGKLTPYQAGALLHGKVRGLVIGNYFVLGKIGAGGMGLVFKARHRRLGRIVALKILPPSFGRDPQLASRFRREVDVAARLSHPNIVSVLDADEDRGVHFLTMEYIDGHDLEQLVQSRGALPVGQAVDCLIQAARGLESAHARGIVHRDVKPSNLMLDSAGIVRMLDLGLARFVEGSLLYEQLRGCSLTETGACMGTVDFMAPEQATDSKRADHRADVYSLGCSLYFLLTGRPPYQGPTALQRIIAHQELPPPSLLAAQVDATKALEKAYQRMMAKRPADRPRSMAEVIVMLEACLSAPEEAEKARSGLSEFARTALKRAAPRRSDESVFARREEMEEFELADSTEFQDVFGDPRFKGSDASRRQPRASGTGQSRKVWKNAAIVLSALTLAITVVVSVLVRNRNDKLVPLETIRVPADQPAKPASLPAERSIVGGYEVREIFLKHAPEQVRSVAVSADGRIAVSGGHDFAAWFWKVDTGEVIMWLPHPKGREVLDVAIVPDGSIAVTGTRGIPADKKANPSGGFRIWDTSGIQRYHPDNPSQGNVNAVAVSRDGRRALWGGSDGELVLWDLVEHRRVRLVGHHPSFIHFHGIAFFPDSRHAATVGGNSEVYIWDVEKGEVSAKLRGHTPPKGCVAVSADGRRVAVGGTDDVVCLWDLPNLENPRRFQTPRCGKELRIAFLPDGKLACTSNETGEVVLWNTDTAELLRQSETFAVGPSMIAALPDGRLLTSDRDGVVRLWTPRDP